MKKFIFLSLLASIALSSQPAHAWWPQGHEMLARAAVRTQPTDVPSWFRKGSELIGHCAQDPDVQKSRDLPLMTEEEYPQHFIDWEMLKGRPLPPTRAEFVKLCRELNVEPSDVGYAPYAVGEWTQRLTMTFAEARKYPKNRSIQTKALVYAGILAHYAGDLCMPLHTTLDHDGRALPDGKSPRTGIHSKVDSLIEKVGFAPERWSENQSISPLPNLWTGIGNEIILSRSKIDQVYALESQLPPEKGDWKASPEVTALTLERGREATRFIASLYLTAWRDSEKIKLPDWLKR